MVGILSILMGILVPATTLVRRKADQLKCMNNLKQVAAQANLFAMDHGDRYPDSVASVGADVGSIKWNWYDPRQLVTSQARTRSARRSMSAYLRSYIESAELLCCPGAPEQPSYLQEMWDAGERWDQPEIPGSMDRVTGNYCFYWNYEGLINIEDDHRPTAKFRGPRGPGSSGRYSKLLATDYFGYGSVLDDPPPNTYASCEMFEGGWSAEAPGVFPYWGQSVDVTGDSEKPEVSLRAVFTDEHVETYKAADAVPMWVIMDRNTLDYYEPGVLGPGSFYLPSEATVQYKP